MRLPQLMELYLFGILNCRILVKNVEEEYESYRHRRCFFRAKDPAVLSDWYEKHLGINGMNWVQQQGPTVFAPFPADTDYFGSESQDFMLNFRVDDLDSMLSQLSGSRCN